MKATKLFSIFVILAIGIILIYSFSNTEIQDTYFKKIQEERNDKDQEFLSSESPLTQIQQNQFQGLTYYPIDKNFKVEAKFSLNPMQETITLNYTDGTQKLYQKYGFADFTLDSLQQRLTVLKPTFFENEKEYLFIPFYDETSALETYGGGRYLDIEDFPENDKIELDFNTAYNPYCAYNEEYRCPIPPKENKITVPVRAGEKIFDLNK